MTDWPRKLELAVYDADWSFVAVFAGAWPAFDNLVRLPRVKAEIGLEGAPRRIREYRFTMLLEWLLVAIALALIVFDQRPWPAAGDAGRDSPLFFGLQSGITKGGSPDGPAMPALLISKSSRPNFFEMYSLSAATW